MMTSDEINELKADIDAVFASRTGTNSARQTSPSNDWVAANYGSLAGKSEAFSIVPQKGEPVLLEHGEKIVNLLRDHFYSNKLSKYGESRASAEKIELPLTKVEKNQPIASDFEYANIKGILNGLGAEKASSNGSSSEATSCKAACSGLCVGSCIGFCNGCVDACSGTCATTCGQNCSSDCKITCSGTCRNNCTSTCNNTCTGTAAGSSNRV